jgi:hypothetical protein
VLCNLEEGWIQRDVRIEEHFQRLFISLGYAVQRMPCLKSLYFEVAWTNDSEFRFENVDKVSSDWDCSPLFRPDSRVAEAWRFKRDDLIIDEWRDTCTIYFATWPPNALVSIGHVATLMGFAVQTYQMEGKSPLESRKSLSSLNWKHSGNPVLLQLFPSTS